MKDNSELLDADQPNRSGSENGPPAAPSGFIAAHEKRFLLWFTLAVMALAALPFLFGHLLSSPGDVYIGFPFNTDDHMVYSAWMWQAMHGSFFFDNRFAIEHQPRLTIHLFYWALGCIARLLGIPLTANLARIGLTGALVPLLYKLAASLTDSVYCRKLSVAVAAFGGGLGFLVWQNFGRQIVSTGLGISGWIKPLTDGVLPTDVWQPEGFTFPSILTNELFVVALVLTLLTYLAVINTRTEKGWKWVVVGMASFGVLMNIHSYDCLLVGLVLIGFLAASIRSKTVTQAWLGRVLIIVAGAIPAALWFVHVIKLDPVFAARAATPTFAADFKAVLAGYLPLIGLSFVFFLRPESSGQKRNKSRIAGSAVLAVMMIVLALAKPGTTGYFLNPFQFGITFAVALTAVWLLTTGNAALDLIQAWAVIGLVAPYIPELFQRKLAMGLAIPWGILAAFGLWELGKSRFRANRNFASVFFLLLVSGSSIQWMARQIYLIRHNVSSTTVQPAYLTPNMEKIVTYLNQEAAKGRVVVMAIPGVPNPVQDSLDQQAPVDSFGPPLIADLNPILSGLAGVYSFAGHWSETPQYMAKRTGSLRSMFEKNVLPEQRKLFIASTGVNYVITISPGIIRNDPYADLDEIGSPVIVGSPFELIKVTQNN